MPRDMGWWRRLHRRGWWRFPGRFGLLERKGSSLAQLEVELESSSLVSTNVTPVVTLDEKISIMSVYCPRG